MSLYSKFVFPRLLDWGLGKPDLDQYRGEVLAGASGETLEIGFGTGLNLPHYPRSVKRLVAIDSELMLPDRVRKRIEAAAFPVEVVHADAQDHLPFGDCSFDTVTTTFTLCSIPEPRLALREMFRVLKPSGRYLFLEHGLGLKPRIQLWQKRLTPINRIVGCGCHLDRAIDRLIVASGFEVTSLDRIVAPGFPRVMGELYRGTARRP